MIDRLHWRADRWFNLGDALSPWIFEAISGRTPCYAAETDTEPYICAVGSFLQVVRRNAIVWGTGLLDSTHTPCPQANYLAVRGPLTSRRILESGGSCPDVYGDPVLLTSRFIAFEHEPERIGLIPQWREQDQRVYAEAYLDPRFEVISIAQRLEGFLLQLRRCRVVLSSSLHAIVLAHAFGVPAGWIEPTSLPLGDGFKFFDYFAGVALGEPPRVRPASIADFIELSAVLPVLPDFDPDRLLAACPFG